MIASQVIASQALCISRAASALGLVLALGCGTTAAGTQGAGANTAGTHSANAGANSAGGDPSLGGTNVGGSAQGGLAQGGSAHGGSAQGASGNGTVATDGGDSGGSGSQVGDGGLSGGGAGGLPMAPTPCPDPEKLEALSLDGSAVGGSDWKARHPTGMNVIDVGWQSATLGQGFILTAAYQGASGSYTPQQLEATLSFGDIPSITCETAEITGTVSFSRVTALNNYSAQVCGSYDITCTDADSGHTVAVKAFFDSTVQTQSVVGPGR